MKDSEEFPVEPCGCSNCLWSILSGEILSGRDFLYEHASKNKFSHLLNKFHWLLKQAGAYFTKENHQSLAKTTIELQLQFTETWVTFLAKMSHWQLRFLRKFGLYAITSLYIFNVIMVRSMLAL